MCFPYTFKALFWMVHIFEDFAPSFFSPSASGSSLPFSEAPFGTLSGLLWASFWACSGARNPPRRASRAHFGPVLVQSCLRIVFAAPISPPTNENLDVMYIFILANRVSVIMNCIQQKQKRMSSKRPWGILRCRDSM